MLAFVIIGFFLSDLRVIVPSCNTRNESPPSCETQPESLCTWNDRKQLAEHVRQFLRQKYQIELKNVVIDAPPKVEMGEFAMPFSFELAKQLRKAPRKIAEEIVAEMPVPEGFENFEVAGAGYINARLKREQAATALAAGTACDRQP